MRSRQVYIKTFGCQMNEHDSEKILEILDPSYCRMTSCIDEADLIFINTCTVREKAEQKAYSALGRLRGLKERKKGLLIAVGGCLAQQEGERLLERFPQVDLVLGTHNLHRLPDLLEEVRASKGRRCETCFYDMAPSMEVVSRGAGKVRAYVTIMQGCNNFCSYCIVPMVRGPEKSRPMERIIDEVHCLAGQGVKEVILLGQNVNSYGRGLGERAAFPELLRRVDAMDGIERIRFTTSHPKDLSHELIQCFDDLPKLCEHIHLPFQSGSNRILKTMNRGYSRDDYMEKISRLRVACPTIAITADVLVGFPGESEEDFQDTLDLIERVQFDGLFSFRYSARKGTVAADLPHHVPEAVKQGRLRCLQQLQEEITLKKNRDLEGSFEPVLAEGRSQKDPHDLTGRTRSNRIVNFPGEAALMGHEVAVRIEKGLAHSLRGVCLPSPRLESYLNLTP